MTETAVTLAAIGVSIVAIGAAIGSCVTAVRMRSQMQADRENLVALWGWIALTVFAGCSATSMWGQVLR